MDQVWVDALNTADNPNQLSAEEVFAAGGGAVAETRLREERDALYVDVRLRNFLPPTEKNPVPKMCVAPTPFERRVVAGYVVERPVTVRSN